MAQESCVPLMLRCSNIHEDPTSFSATLRNTPNPLSEFLKEQFSPETRHLLDKYRGKGPIPPSLRIALNQDLARLVRDNSIYDERRFEHVKLSEETIMLEERKPTGVDRYSFNWMLLADAYPKAIVTNNLNPMDHSLELCQKYLNKIFLFQDGENFPSSKCALRCENVWRIYFDTMNPLVVAQDMKFKNANENKFRTHGDVGNVEKGALKFEHPSFKNEKGQIIEPECKKEN